MSITSGLGASSLLSLGVSVSDVALAIQHGRTIGNWLRVAAHDAGLFETLSEDLDAALTRRGLVDQALMERHWAGNLKMVYHGRICDGSTMAKKKTEAPLGRFTWLMIAVVSTLDISLPASSVKKVVTDVMVQVLSGDEEVRESLNIQIATNIASWRSVGVVRGLVPEISKVLKRSRKALVNSTVVPELNPAETTEMKSFLVWLLVGKDHFFTAVSATIFATAEALRAAGFHLKVEGDQDFEDQPIIRYAGRDASRVGILDQITLDSSGTSWRSPPAQNAFPIGEPQRMIGALPRSIKTRNEMAKYWTKGANAAYMLAMRACVAENVLYRIECIDDVRTRWDTGRLLIVEACFPMDSEALLRSLDELMASYDTQTQNWLVRYVTKREGSQIEDLRENFTREQLDLFTTFQALCFGYYYSLVEEWISTDLAEADIYCKGIWGFRDRTLLKWCQLTASKFRRPHELSLRDKDGKIERSHLIRLLAVMYCGIERPLPPGALPELDQLLGIVGGISIISQSLLTPTDDPGVMTRFSLVTLPVVELLVDGKGELLAAGSTYASGVSFESGQELDRQPSNRRSSQADNSGNGQTDIGTDRVREPGLKKVVIKGPAQEWSVHPKLLHGTNSLGNQVVMAARCGGVLIGTFCPNIADRALFQGLQVLPTGNSRKQDENQKSASESFQGLVVDESHFLKGVLPRPGALSFPLIVQSRGNAAMRYAASGFYAQSIELALVTVSSGNLQELYEWVKGDSHSVLIT